MAVLTLVVYIANIQVPTGVSKFLEYIGNCTTFLSMIVLGVSVAQMIPAKVFRNIRLYGFILIRQIAVPIFIAFLLKPFGLPELMLRTIVIMVAMPAANMPLMVSKQFGIEEENLAAGIIFTTLASILTIPIVMLFL
jgi:predicted permease